MWQSAADLHAYDCRAHANPTWESACPSSVVRKPASGDARRLRYVVPEADVTDTLRRLHGRTMLILGDSTSVELWCALTCAFMQVGARLAPQPHATALSRAISGAVTVGMSHDALKVSMDWMLPSCGAAKPHCWHGHSVHSAHHCGHDFLDALRRVGAFSGLRSATGGSNRLGGTKLVVLFNPW